MKVLLQIIHTYALFIYIQFDHFLFSPNIQIYKLFFFLFCLKYLMRFGKDTDKVRYRFEKY